MAADVCINVYSGNTTVKHGTATTFVSKSGTHKATYERTKVTNPTTPDQYFDKLNNRFDDPGYYG